MHSCSQAGRLRPRPTRHWVGPYPRDARGLRWMRERKKAARTLHAVLCTRYGHWLLWRPLATLHKVLQGAATCGERRSKMVPLTSNNNRVSASSQPRSSSALLFDFPPAATLREMTIASVYVTYQFRGGIRE